MNVNPVQMKSPNDNQLVTTIHAPDEMLTKVCTHDAPQVSNAVF